jgi:hypothetical protein
VSRYDETKLLARIDFDYERTTSFIEGITGTSATIRGWAITIWLAVVGVAFDRGSWELAALGAVVALVFFVIDAYHAWLYGEALLRATAIEQLQGEYYTSLGRRADDPDGAGDLRKRLEEHRFGLYRNFKRFRLKDIAFARPFVFFRLFYPFLAAVAIGAAILLATQSSDDPACKAIPDTGETAIQCGDVVIVDGDVARPQ